MVSTGVVHFLKLYKHLVIQFIKYEITFRVIWSFCAWSLWSLMGCWNLLVSNIFYQHPFQCIFTILQVQVSLITNKLSQMDCLYVVVYGFIINLKNQVFPIISTYFRSEKEYLWFWFNLKCAYKHLFWGLFSALPLRSYARVIRIYGSLVFIILNAIYATMFSVRQLHQESDKFIKCAKLWVNLYVCLLKVKFRNRWKIIFHELSIVGKTDWI